MYCLCHVYTAIPVMRNKGGKMSYYKFFVLVLLLAVTLITNIAAGNPKHQRHAQPNGLISYQPPTISAPQIKPIGFNHGLPGGSNQLRPRHRKLTQGTSPISHPDQPPHNNNIPHTPPIEPPGPIRPPR